MKLVSVSKSAHFNQAAADRAHAWVMEDMDRAMAVLPFVCHELAQNEIFDHREVIQKALDIYAGPRLEAVAKAFGSDQVNRDQRGRYSHDEKRKKRIAYSDTRRGSVRVTAAEHPGAAGLKSHDRQHYAQALNQVADEINSAIDNGYDTADTYWRAVWRSKDGSLSHTQGVGLSPQSIVDSRKFNDGNRLVEVGMTSKPTLSAGGAAYDLMSAVSSPNTAYELGAAFGRAGTILNEPAKRDALAAGVNGYRTGQTGDETSTTRLFNRLRSIGTVATNVMGEHAPAQAKLAAHVATMVGEYGPEAEKVIGPATRRASYRYRGVEKKPDPRLQAIIDRTVTGELARAEKAGKTQKEARNLAREAVVYGRQAVGGTRPGQARETAVESPLIQYFQTRLPKPDLYELQRKSGTIPPSQGVIIDRHGRVAHEAVGYGEDWYLPFNLKNLKDLKGGEYIRTRAYGGLTTEDIYTGLVSGARSVTVVSNSGTFTLEFDDTFRGGRRLNDKAARMVSRYGHLLDTVKGGGVTIDGVERSRMSELEATAERYADPSVDEPAYNAELKRLKERELRHPQLSAQIKSKIAQDALDEAARDWATDQGFTARDLTEAVAHDRAAGIKRLERAAAHYGAKTVDPGLLARYNEDFAAKWENPGKVVGAERRIAAMEAATLDEQRRRMSTLTLDGSGYDYAAQALEEQFPYYISRYESRDRKGRSDEGYVKPRFNRPQGAKSGYYDTTITGRGKVSADKTGYQNFGVDRKAAEPAAADDEEPTPARPATAGAATVAAPVTQTLSALGAQRQAIFDAAKALRTAGKISTSAHDNANGLPLDEKVIGVDISPVMRDKIRAAFPALHDPELENRIRSGDAAFQAKVAAELQVLADTQMIDHDFGAALGKKVAVHPKWDPVTAMGASQPMTYDFGDDFAPDAGGSSPKAKYEHFARLLERDPDIKKALALNDLDDESISVQDLPDRISVARAEVVGDYQEAERELADDAANPLRAGSATVSAKSLGILLEELHGLDKAHQVTTSMLKAHQAGAVAGKAVEPEEHPVGRVVFSQDEEQAKAAAAAVTRAGGVPELAGEIPKTEYDHIISQALEVPESEKVRR